MYVDDGIDESLSMPDTPSNPEHIHVIKSSDTEGIRNADTMQPDVGLLALCGFLKTMQVEWRRLYEAAMVGGPCTSADRTWMDYSNRVWPGIGLSAWGDQSLHPDDVPGQLWQFRATTVEGIAAKTSAMLALEEAASSCSCRTDASALAFSLLRDVAEADPI